MTYSRLLTRSLVFHRSTHLWVILGTLISTAILSGALIIADSIRASLSRIVLSRLGKTEFALASGDRFFQTETADRLASTLGTLTAPILQTKGVVVVGGGAKRANRVQIFGVDGRFGAIGDCREIYNALAPHEALINLPLASRLQIRQNDEILLRMERLSFFPKDTPLTPDQTLAIAKRFKVRAIVDDTQFGRFHLQADQVAPLSVFVSLASLSDEMELAQRANMLLVSARPGTSLRETEVARGFKAVWTLADAGLELLQLPGKNRVELRSNRVFLDPEVSRAARIIEPTAQPVLTYLVNGISRGSRTTHYSFVSAAGTSILPSDMKENDILVNEWLSEDLHAGAGDSIRLSYYTLGLSRTLNEETSAFRVRAVVPLEGDYADRDLMPAFPGLADKENCREWDPGFSIDLSKIRDKDEAYWNHFRGTPKAFVTLLAAQKMWTNRFGDSTAIRFAQTDQTELERRLLQEMDPAALGLDFREVRKEGLRAGQASVDFAGLFLGLSFFIILSGLLLTALLFVLNVEQRAEENGILLAVGFSRKEVRRIVLAEGGVLIVLGSALGAVVGIIYNQIILYALQTIWRGAVGTSALQLHLRFSTLALGALLGMVVAFCTIALVVRRQFQFSISSLQKGIDKVEGPEKAKPWISLWIGLICGIAVIVILLTVDLRRGEDAFLYYFMAGALVLAGGTSWANLWLFRLGKSVRRKRLNLYGLGVRNNVRKRFRSISLIGVLAGGLFIVFSVGANRRSVRWDAEQKSSGTGGFTLLGESTLPILYDLNSPQGKRFYRLGKFDGTGVSYVQFRVQDGDDASCLNLNRVSRPRLLGVHPEELAKRRSFAFVETIPQIDSHNPWLALNQVSTDGSIPAFADHSVIVWGLGKAVGDTLSYINEKGREFRVRLVGSLANSVFQGSLIISEAAFLQHYPSSSGYRFFLVDAPLAKNKVLADGISWALEDLGVDLTAASTRLAEFNEVQNTYLSIFLILGSFGLMLGSIGFGIVAWRNIQERQGELALLRAIGFGPWSIRLMVLSEHFAVWLAGVFLGIAAALVATFPSLSAQATEIPYTVLAILFILILANGGIWILLATFWATKRDLLPSLRNE